ncbi:MAG: UrcA family protein [Pseudomonadota bacterium]
MTMTKPLAALSAVFLIAAPSALAGSVEVTSKPVSVAGLDLNSPTGADIALDRIEAAAESVCDYSDRRLKILHRARTEACTATAIKKAVKNIGHDALTERYKARFQSQ